MISQIIATGGRSHSLHKSTAASVCPFLSKRPPFFDKTGKRCPGFIKSDEVELGFATSCAVIERSNADIPVEVPYSVTASIASRNAVWCGSFLLLLCFCKSSRIAVLWSMAIQTKPFP